MGLWDLTGRRVRLVASPDAAVPTYRCHDAWVDWATVSGHYDARLTRNCDPGSYRETDSGGDGWEPEPSNWGGRNVTGIQKGAGCVHNQNSITFDTCAQYPQNLSTCSIGSDYTLTQMKNFVRYWIRYQDGTIGFNSGGKVQEAGS